MALCSLFSCCAFLNRLYPLSCVTPTIMIIPPNSPIRNEGLRRPCVTTIYYFPPAHFAVNFYGKYLNKCSSWWRQLAEKSDNGGISEGFIRTKILTIVLQTHQVFILLYSISSLIKIRLYTL